MENDPKTIILNVDDDDAGRYAISRTLRQAGFDVKEASNGKEALRFAEEQPHLILLDVNLPDINGFEVCRIIKNNPLTSHIPVLHLSATYLDDESKVRGLETADGYLTQPVEPLVLISTIKALLRVKRAEEAVKESLNRWQATFDGIKDSIFLLDKEGVIFQINKNATKLFGKTEKEIQGHHCWEIVHGTSEPIAGCPIVRMKQSKQRETMLLPIDNKWYEVTVDPLLSQDGNLLGAVHIISDITERKKAEEKLRASREQLRALAGRLHAAREEERTNIAREIHDELGGALTGLKIDFSLLTRVASKIEDETVRRSLLDRMNSMTKFIDSTIQTVRRIAMELRPGVLDDLGLVAALEWQLKDFEKRTGIRSEFSPPVEEISLDADLSTALFRIFQEALTNVARHSGATEVRVRLSVDADSSTLEVEDNGKGIKKEKTLSSESLGLLGMRERAQMFGGRLTVKGTPGKGTKVTVEISPVEKRKMDRDQDGDAG